MKPAIRVDKISKQYRLGLSPNKDNNLTENLRVKARHTWDKIHRLLHPHKEHHEDESFWALKDVSFEVQPGEMVGIIGRNGAGKSTLLKILSQIVEPTSGYAEVRGRMGSLLEVGTGFHPELTGRENIYLNGSILGMSKKEIDKKFDEIVAFSEIERFLDTPIKRYSSGMYVRLAFAVAAHLEPEILVVDEVLAVGDATFQRRCVERMTHLARQGRTILFVSHNLQLVSQLCHRAVLLDSGKVSEIGPSIKITKLFLDRFLSDAKSRDLRNKRRTCNGPARFVRGFISNPEGQPLAQFLSGEDLIIRMEIESKDSVENVALAAVVQSVYGMRLITSWTKECEYDVSLRPGIQAFECVFKNVNLRPGHTVFIDLWMEGANVFDLIEKALVLDVHSDQRRTQFASTHDQGIVLCEYEWRQVRPDCSAG